MAALLGVGAALAGVLAGCASGPTVPPSSARASASCLIVPGIAAPPAERNEPLTVGLTRPVNPDHAPAPTNPDEAFLFGLLYESLVGIDCTGRLLSGLASAWESDDGGRRWTFTLRTDARFWDGDPVTARHVADGWRRLEESGRSPW
ncbi:MAG: ABC transporter substrate-binding protein, partial [Gemmatimonadota bacterium]